MFTERNPLIVRAGKKFVYAKTRRAVNTNTSNRIRALGIPPAYKKLWLARNESSPLQAVALDPGGKKQYFYSRKWDSKQTRKKFKRMEKFERLLPKVKTRVARDIRKGGQPRVRAMALRCLYETCIRVGNMKYLNENRSVGLTTLQKRHVKSKGGKVYLQFKGKSGVKQMVPVHDASLKRFLLEPKPSGWVFAYNGSRLTSEELNAYLQSIIGPEFTCKDFRTHGANEIFLAELQAIELPETVTEAKRNVSHALERTARALGNTKATSRKSYVMSYIVDLYTSDPEWIQGKRLVDIL